VRLRLVQAGVTRATSNPEGNVPQDAASRQVKSYLKAIGYAPEKAN
jgi:hypothetical protein